MQDTLTVSTVPPEPAVRSHDMVSPLERLQHVAAALAALAPMRVTRFAVLQAQEALWLVVLAAGAIVAARLDSAAALAIAALTAPEKAPVNEALRAPFVASASATVGMVRATAQVAVDLGAVVSLADVMCDARVLLRCLDALDDETWVFIGQKYAPTPALCVMSFDGDFQALIAPVHSAPTEQR